MDDRYLKQSRPQSRRYRKRVLAVRAMAGETAWLEGCPIWRDGRVVWEAGRTTVVPNRSLLATSQRRLTQVAAHPRASRQAFGDVTGWLARRLDRLALAKCLFAFNEPDLVALCSPMSLRHKDERALQQLASLLIVEATCLNRLPASPSHALYSCGGRAVQPILSAVLDHDALRAGRALAALVMGALRKAGKWYVESAISFGSQWQERAYTWGLHNGMPDDPALFASLLQEENISLLDQFAGLRERAVAHLPGTESLRKLLDRGVPATTVVELCRACAEIETLVGHIGNYRDDLPDRHAPWRVEVASDLRKERAKTIGELVGLVHRYALGTIDPKSVRDAIALTSAIIHARGKYHTALGEAAFNVLRLGLDLPIEMQGAYLRLLHNYSDLIWADFEEVAERNLKGWLSSEHMTYVIPVCSALEKYRDPDLVRHALEIDRPFLLTSYTFKDPEIFRFALSLLADYDLIYRHWNLMAALAGANFAGAKEARQALRPLAQAVMQAPPDCRADLLDQFLSHFPSRTLEASEQANRWATYVPALLAFLVGRRAMLSTLVEIVVQIDKVHADHGLDWFPSLLAALKREITPDVDVTMLSASLPLTVSFGLALAGDDYASFQRIALAALSHSFDHDSRQIEKAIGVLRQFPVLRSALARIFPLQPHRCMDLAVKIGLASQLGKDAMSPLGYLERSALIEVALPEEWRALVAVAPGVEEAARSYLLAHQVRGESAAVPPGVRKALEQPHRLAAELSYIEKKLAEYPARADLRARVDSLRTRLESHDKLMAEVRVEIEERLGQAGAEAHIACAEIRTLECYRARLETLAGPLPPDLPINDNLVNATLLLGDISSNRKLLLRLLRAYVRGNRRPHDRHPGNVRFLEGLAALGVDTQAWLLSNPRNYPCKGVAGGKVRLMLERDPLGILQMGNYFDTCLSFGQFNSFSTVANACELNKRVVYAYDGAGKVVGRKLIGINREGKLVGFYTYSMLGQAEGNALRAIFRRYCVDFAQKCGLELAEAGTIPRLFAERWYDDGVVPWSDAEDEQAAQHHSGSGPASRAVPELELAAPVSAIP
jgi:hypothetical protein